MENEVLNPLLLTVAAAVGGFIPVIATKLFGKIKTFVGKTENKFDDEILASFERSIQSAATKAINKQKEKEAKK